MSVWRVGSKVPVNIYKDNRIAGQCQTPELAAEIVEALNRPFQWDRLGEFLREQNLTVFTFPDMETGKVFWLVRQPDTDPIGTGRTLSEALKEAGIPGLSMPEPPE